MTLVLRIGIFAFGIVHFSAANIQCDSTDAECLKYDTMNLIDLHDFHFIINNDICPPNDDVDLLFVVSSKPDNFKYRKAQRETWGNVQKYKDLVKYKVVFMLMEPNDKLVQEKVLAESEKHKDVIQGSAIDSYGNLTYKHMMGLKWALSYCKQAPYIIKVDDDVYADIFLVADNILKRFGRGGTNLIVCGWLFETNKPYRDKTNKYYVSYEEYPWDDAYPEFCSGGALMYSKDVAEHLYNLSFRTPYFKLEDVYATALLRRKLGVRPLVFEGHLGLQWNPTAIKRHITSKSPQRTFLFGLTTDVQELYDLWDKLKTLTPKAK